MLANLWPWLAVAAAGALHGLNPLTGWAFAAWDAHGGTTAARSRLLVPIAAGQLGAVLVVAAAVPAALQFGLAFPPWLPQGLAAGLLLVLALRHCGRASRPGRPAPRGRTIGLWSFVVGIGHGAGWMLVPALASVCGAEAPGREITASGSLVLGLAAVGVHLAAMLAATALMAAGARRLATYAGAPPFASAAMAAASCVMRSRKRP